MTEAIMSLLVQVESIERGLWFFIDIVLIWLIFQCVMMIMRRLFDEKYMDTAMMCIQSMPEELREAAYYEFLMQMDRNCLMIPVEYPVIARKICLEILRKNK